MIEGAVVQRGKTVPLPRHEHGSIRVIRMGTPCPSSRTDSHRAHYSHVMVYEFVMFENALRTQNDAGSRYQTE